MKSKEEIVWVYIEEFKPFINAEAYGNHPKEGRVYRAVHDLEHKIYKLAFYDEQEEQEELDSTSLGGILIHELEQENTAWRYSVKVINNKNIGDFDIEPEDFLKMEKWKKNPAAGIESLLTGGTEFEGDPLTKVIKQEETSVQDWIELLKRYADENQEEIPQPPQKPRKKVAGKGKRNEDAVMNSLWKEIAASNAEVASAFRSILRPLSDTFVLRQGHVPLSTIESILGTSMDPTEASKALVTRALMDYGESQDKASLYEAIIVLVYLLSLNHEF